VPKGEIFKYDKYYLVVKAGGIKKPMAGKP
jgi:hypothetical protein